MAILIPHLIQQSTIKKQATLSFFLDQLRLKEWFSIDKMEKFTIKLTSGIRSPYSPYSPEKIERIRKILIEEGLEFSKIKTDLETRIQTLRQEILNINPVVAPQLQNDMLDIIGCPQPLLGLIDQYV